MPLRVRRWKQKARKRAVATSGIDKQQERQITKIFKTLNQTKPETKWAEYSNAGISVDYNGAIVSFSTGLSQGLGDFGNRIGDEITMKGLRLRLQPYVDRVGPTIYRVILFQYLNDPDGATSTASILNMLLHSTNIASNLAVSTPYDHDNRSSFKVYYDRSFVFNTQTLTSTNTNPGQSHHHKIDIKIPQKYAKVKYFAGGTTTTRNELLMVIITDNSSYMTVPYDAIVYYTDS